MHEEAQREHTSDVEEAAKMIVDSAFRVHRVLGPGLLESAYQQCLAHELRKRGAIVKCEVDIPIFYDGTQIGKSG